MRRKWGPKRCIRAPRKWSANRRKENSTRRLAFDEFLSAKLHYYTAVFGGCDERVVLFGSDAGERLKPVGEVSDAFFHSPLFHLVCDYVCHIARKRQVKRATSFEFAISFFGQTLAHHLVVEHHATVQIRHHISILRKIYYIAYYNHILFNVKRFSLKKIFYKTKWIFIH